MIEIIVSVAGAVISGGSLGLLLFYRQKQRKERAEATAAEIDNQSAINDEYRKVTDEWKTIASDMRNESKEALSQVQQLRQERDCALKENARLTIAVETDKVRLCQVRNCANREPHTGY